MCRLGKSIMHSGDEVSYNIFRNILDRSFFIENKPLKPLNREYGDKI